ncbi:MAG: lipoyl(octanoyl) transferase LipB [Rhodospirillales bacterium]|nr:lipoyl(octanoyl) transferase LipB [Rhodospirillales bacterium]
MEWRNDDTLVDYDQAVSFMEARVAAIHAHEAPETIWLLEHPPLYTAGTSATESDLLTPDRFPVYATGRGGQYTYHGPGQRVGYVMLDLNKRGRDVRAYVRALEQWIITTLAEFGVRGERRSDRIGIWVDRGNGIEEKIAAIGVRLRRWVSYHGIALNVHPDLEHFSGIVPCGVSRHGVTSLKALGIDASLADVDAALKRTFDTAFPSETESVRGETSA